MSAHLMDTGLNAPESEATLYEQQKRLIGGMRAVQMFPVGTQELALPVGMMRFENDRGIFHFDPTRITAQRIMALSAIGRENEFLELGPYSKIEIAYRVAGGQRLIAITEYTPEGVEVRSAGGTDQTLAKQLEFFEHTKQNGNYIVAGPFPDRAMAAAAINRGAA